MAEPSVNLIYGKRKTGKTYLINYLCKSLTTQMVIISSTDKIDMFYSKRYPNAEIHHEYNSEIITRVFEKQQNNENNLIIIFDDCFPSYGPSDKNLIKLFENHEELNLTIYMTLLYPMFLHPRIKAAFTHVFLFAENNISIQKKLYEQYAKIYSKFEDFQKEYINWTQDYGVMVIDRRTGEIFKYNTCDKPNNELQNIPNDICTNYFGYIYEFLRNCAP